MAVWNRTAVFRVRVGGNDLNSAAYDPAITGGADLSQADAATASFTNLTSTASTTITSASATFTAAMKGNALRISSGAGATVGYYFIQSVTNATTIVVDRVSGTYTVGVGRIGGAAATLQRLYDDAGASGNKADDGNIIYMRGAGSDTPTTNDYTTTGVYVPVPGATGTRTEMVKVIGENGRPRLSSDGPMLGPSIFMWLENLYLTASSTALDIAIVQCNEGSVVKNCYIDTNNQDRLPGIQLLLEGSTVVDSVITGTTGTPAIDASSYGIYALRPCVITNCTISGMRADGIKLFDGGTVTGCIVHNNANNGILLDDDGSSENAYHVEYNVINANGADGIHITNTDPMMNIVRNNIITSNVGRGVYVNAATVAIGDFYNLGIDYNVLFGNGSTYANYSGGPHDTTDTDPGYTDAAALDFSTGPAMAGLAWPGLIRGSTTTSYPRPGVWQSGGADLTRILRKVIDLEKRLHLYQLRTVK